MPTFILSLNWTDQGIRGVKEAPKRSQAARGLAKKLGVEIKQVYLTSGENDLLLIVESASGDNVAKFALATGSLGNVRTRTVRAWSEVRIRKAPIRVAVIGAGEIASAVPKAWRARAARIELSR